MPTEIIILIAALIVSWMVFRALVGILKTAVSTAVAVLVIVLILNFFGITPENLIEAIKNLPETVIRLFPEQTETGI